MRFSSHASPFSKAKVWPISRRLSKWETLPRVLLGPGQGSVQKLYSVAFERRPPPPPPPPPIPPIPFAEVVSGFLFLAFEPLA